MKEKIVEIFRKKEEWIGNDDAGGFGVLETEYKDVADEILALGWYPKEFVEWIGKNEMFFETRYPLEKNWNNKWHRELNVKTGEVEHLTTDELYQYWIENIKQ